MEEVGASHICINHNSVPTKKTSEDDKSHCCCSRPLPVRVQIGIMSFFMFFVTQMIRSNLYIAHVGMGNATLRNDTVKIFSSSVESVQWTEQETAVVFSAFYWCYWITELPGGLLAQRFGSRQVLGIGVLLAGIANLAFPIACNTHFILAALLRAIQGLTLGVTWPATHVISAHWIPSTERSKFMTSYHGSAVGTALTYPLGGILISFLNWEAVFIVTGLLTIVWSFFWWYLVYDKPSTHPRVTMKEKKYLERTIGNTISSHKKSLKTPWSAILCSAPFWAVLLASQGLIWGTITLSMQLPSYFRSVHKMDVKTNGVVSGIPEFCKFIFSIIFSTLIDYALRKKYLSTTAARKIAVSTSEFLPALLLVVLAYFGTENPFVAVLLLASTSAVGGASSSGSLSNIVDLSPNFSGTLLGLIKTLTVIPGVLSPMLVSVFSEEYGSVDCWYYVFITMAAVYASCGAVFLLFGSGEVQPWNQPDFMDLPGSIEQETKENHESS